LVPRDQIRRLSSSHRTPWHNVRLVTRGGQD
jgi:ATP-dependent DNA ligase